MRSGLSSLILAGLACVASATPAHALICYVIYDRSENVIYQSTYPPVDMSNAGYPERDALRARGEHLTFGDVANCPTVVFLTGAGGTSELRVDEVVGGMSARNIPGHSQRGPPCQVRQATRAPLPRAPPPRHRRPRQSPAPTDPAR